MSRRRELDNILNECLERCLVKGETVEQCLNRFAEYKEALKPLLETALTMKKASTLQPRPEFREKARYHFYSVLRETERRREHPFFGWRQRWVTVVAVVFAFLLAGGSTVAVADNSMPDDFLYPVKLATEQVRVVLTPSALGKAEFYAQLSDKRVAEIARMAVEGKPEQIERATRRLNIHLTKITELALAKKITRRQVPVPPAREGQLPGETPLLPELAGDRIGTPVRVDHRARLRALVISHASNRPAQLRALLKTVPSSARSALLRAISISETGYEEAIKSLEP